jgi:hypothetical protein
MKHAFTIATLMFLFPMSASANIPIPVPEPGILPLLAIGGVIWLAFNLKKRKK